HPDVQHNLAREIDNFIIKYYRFPTFDDLAELPYSNALLKESLRFRLPVYFGIPRKATKDVVCRNYLIPKGSTIVGNIYAISNDNYVIQNPEKFLPERFQYDSRTLHAGANEGPEEHCAFGWQKRICPGISLAETQMFNIVTKVMSRCTIEPDIASNGQAV
ncbi:cytochrome P450 CYP5207, partial [Mucor lusitanicus CBS 277.49]